MRRLRDESGQVFPLLALGLLVALLGVVGLVVDVASWYRAQRHVQAVADAAALAAVQALPGGTAQAASLARSYAAQNGGTIDDPRFSTSSQPGDTIAVRATAQAPSYFARLFGVDGVTVHASATARAQTASEVANVVPLAISGATEALRCGCFGEETTLTFDRLDAGGAFGLVDFANAAGNATPGELAGWIESGFPGRLSLGDYQSAPGNRFNAAAVRSALEDLAARHATVLVPIYSDVSGNGANATFTISGFGAFRVDGFSRDGGRAQLTGSFQRTIAHGTPTGQDAEYYGVASVGLVG